MDDVAPESGQDDPLREKRYQRGTACAYRSGCFTLLKARSSAHSVLRINVQSQAWPAHTDLQFWRPPRGTR